MERQTKESKVFEAIDAIEVNDALSKSHIIKKIWGTFDHFTSRSFDVFYYKAKKNLPDKEFKVNSGDIIRIR